MELILSSSLLSDKAETKPSAEKGAFLSSGAHILRSTSLGFSTVDVALGLHPDSSSNTHQTVESCGRGGKVHFILIDNEVVWLWAMSRC